MLKNYHVYNFYQHLSMVLEYLNFYQRSLTKTNEFPDVSKRQPKHRRKLNNLL